MAMSDLDKQQWQAEQEALSAAMDKQREKERKARERSARNAQRKLERLRRTLSASGELSDWEDEFSESVTERLDKYGSAFHDLEKGRPGDALSFAQKRVLASLNKKAKDQRKAARLNRNNSADLNAQQSDEAKPERQTRPKSSFKSKRKKTFTPRVRQIDEDFGADELGSDEFNPPASANPFKKTEPFIPDFTPKPASPKPFLRLVK
jgi:hypothetical protein